MTFSVSHLECCNIRGTVVSLWCSRVISGRVTYLELCYGADKSLLCPGHLEGQRRSLHWTPERKTTSDVVIDISHNHLLVLLRGEEREVALILLRICYSTQGVIWKWSKHYLKHPEEILKGRNNTAARCLMKALCRDQVIERKSSSFLKLDFFL